MKRAILVLLVLLGSVSVANAGVGRVATFPVRHPKKTAQQVKKHALRPAYHVTKTLLW